jgi:hypothetical protein
VCTVCCIETWQPLSGVCSRANSGPVSLGSLHSGVLWLLLVFRHVIQISHREFAQQPSTPPSALRAAPPAIRLRTANLLVRHIIRISDLNACCQVRSKFDTADFAGGECTYHEHLSVRTAVSPIDRGPRESPSTAFSIFHPSRRTTMPFTLNGTQIDGGTFNSVSGNMTQVFNSHVARIEAPMHPRVVQEPGGHLRRSLLPSPRAFTDLSDYTALGPSSIGPIRRRPHGSRYSVIHPYGARAHKHFAFRTRN